ncbi:MAG: FAD-dependent oxidoreductase [Cytophagales bacterium]|nr:FAD-dependent oxidoreductase [Cytophagales bacterium]
MISISFDIFDAMISFWEQRSFFNYDFIIVGAGITGLSTAATIKERDPSSSVLVLERGLLPTGASTKNAGFACFGSLTELLADIDVMGEEAMMALVEKRINGLRKTEARLGKELIDLQIKGGYELINAIDDLEDKMVHVNHLLSDSFENPVFQRIDHQLSNFGFSGFDGLILNQYEGQLDTGKLIRNLWEYCNQIDVKILTGAEVIAVNEEEGGVRVNTAKASFQCKRAGICTNAFTRKFMDVDLQPGRGMVMAIEPRNPLPFEGIFHYDEGYYYFRDFYGKLIFGGGRNLDKKAEETTEFGINPAIESRLHDDLRDRILPGQDYEVIQQWSGIMAFGDTKTPIVKKMSDRIAIGVRLGGMGVAIGSMVGEELAELLIESFV